MTKLSKIFVAIFAIAMVFSFANKANAQQSNLAGTNVVVSLTGNIFDHTTRDPLSVNITVKDNTGRIIQRARSNSVDGFYFMSGFRPGKTYDIHFVKDGYFNTNYKLEVPNTGKYEEISKDFLIIPLSNETKIPLAVPPFEINKSKVRYGADIILEDLTNALKNNPKVKFEILCYPDNMENRSENLEFTQERAESLKQYFSIKGIDPNRITTQGSEKLDPYNTPPSAKASKGKRYIGTTYIVIKDF